MLSPAKAACELSPVGNPELPHTQACSRLINHPPPNQHCQNMQWTHQYSSGPSAQSVGESPGSRFSGPKMITCLFPYRIWNTLGLLL